MEVFDSFETGATSLTKTKWNIGARCRPERPAISQLACSRPGRAEPALRRTGFAVDFWFQSPKRRYLLGPSKETAKGAITRVSVLSFINRSANAPKRSGRFHSLVTVELGLHYTEAAAAGTYCRVRVSAPIPGCRP